MDAILHKPKSAGVRAVAYEDDLVILVLGLCTSTISDDVEEASKKMHL